MPPPHYKWRGHKNKSANPTYTYLTRNLCFEYKWLQFVSLTNEVLDDETWSAYHSSLMPILETGHGMTNAIDIILPHIKSLTQNLLRVGVVLDVYYEDSLKGETRRKLTRKMTGNTRPPHAWNTFLQCNDNKTEHFICSKQNCIQ